MYSIYHFFKHLSDNKSQFKKDCQIEDFPFDKNMLSCQNVGVFPDLAIKLNKPNSLFTGGELIELKDSKTYSVTSFNSTIPTGQKEIAKVIKGENSTIRKQMMDVGDDIESLPVRNVYYLIRGKSKGNVKVVLVHGSFFETIKSSNLISDSFGQVLDERLREKKLDIDDNVKELLADIFSEQENFSKVRNVEKASVKLRFRIMTEVKAEGNILNTEKYPEIKDNTLNLVIPRHAQDDEDLAVKLFSNVCDLKQFKQIKIKHHLNGYFTVFQQDL